MGVRVTVTVELPADLAAALTAQAQANGLDLSQYVGRLLCEQATPHAGAALSPAERAAAWRDSVRGLPHTQPLSGDAISRESIYGDRGR